MEGTIGGVSNVSLPSQADAGIGLPGVDLRLAPPGGRRSTGGRRSSRPTPAVRANLATVPSWSQSHSDSRARPTQEVEGGE